MEFFDVIGIAGEGAHGIVLKAQHLPTGNIVALKKVTLKRITEEGIPIKVIREVKALQYIEKHENIISLIDVFPQGLSFVMVFEFMSSNLWEILDTYRLTGSQAKCYMLMLLKGLEFIHANHIMHRDLKPSNLLISNEGILKIADFGLCRLFFPEQKRAYSHQVATRWYRSPELLYGARFYDEGVDTWAAGCIFGEMLKGGPIFQGENDIDQLYTVISSLGTPNEEIWPGCTEFPDYNKIVFGDMEPQPLEYIVPSEVPEYKIFLNKFLVYNSKQRLSANMALEDDFFRTEPLPCSLNELPPLPVETEKNNFEFGDFDFLPYSKSCNSPD